MNAIHITNAGKKTAGSTFARSVSRITSAAVLFTSLSCTGGNPSLNGNLTFNSDGGLFPDGRVGSSDGNMPIDTGAGGHGGFGGGQGGAGGSGGFGGMGGSDATFADARPSDSTVRPDARPSDATPKPDSRPSDAVVRPDASPSDAVVPDARPLDAQLPDALVESDALGTPDAHPLDAARLDAARNDAARPDAISIPDEGTPDSSPSDASPPDAEPDSSFAGCVSDESCENIHEICVEEQCVLAPVTCEDDPSGNGTTLRQGRWSEFFFNICQGANRLLARCFGDHVEDVERPCAEGDHCEDQGQGVLACVAGTPDAGVADAGPSDSGASDATSDGPLDGTPDVRVVRDATADARVDGTPDAARLDAARADAAADAAVDASPDATREDAAVVYNFCNAFDVLGNALGPSTVHAEPFIDYLSTTPQRFRQDHGTIDPNYVAVLATNSPANPQFVSWIGSGNFDALVANGTDHALPYLLISAPGNDDPSAQIFTNVTLAAYVLYGRAYELAVVYTDIQAGLDSSRFRVDSSWQDVAGVLDARRNFSITPMEHDQRILDLNLLETQLVRSSGLQRSPAILQFDRTTGNCVIVEFPEGAIPTAQTLLNMRQGL